jgi:hypothetical protein
MDQRTAPTAISDPGEGRAEPPSVSLTNDQRTRVAGRGEGLRVGRGGLSASSRESRSDPWLPTTLPQTFRSGASSVAPGSSRALSRRG